MKATEKAYLAGLIDGEGSVGVKKRAPSAANHRITPEYIPRVQIAMTDRRPLDMLASVFGAPSGGISLRRGTPNHKAVYFLEITHQHAAILLKLLYPYLIVKQRQAMLVSKIAALRTAKRKNRLQEHSTLYFQGGRNKGHPYSVMRLSDEHLQTLEGLYQELKSLNKKGPR